jgi:hypothetical protein
MWFSIAPRLAFLFLFGGSKRYEPLSARADNALRRVAVVDLVAQNIKVCDVLDEKDNSVLPGLSVTSQFHSSGG